jgi:2-polyprenyl-3-methyl-5-hydroxy-6-metoxy-1,4-benzoquinol methylase
VNKTENFWNAVAIRTAASSDRISKTSQQIIELTSRHLAPDFTVLDFGCGAGALTNRFAARVRSICGIDTASQMIDLARQRAQAASISNATYLQSDIFDASLGPCAYDAILAHNVLHYIPDQPATLHRIKTLLKPGGLLISSTACLAEKKLSPVRLLLQLLAWLGLVPEMQMYRSDFLPNVMSNAGFEVVAQHKISGLPEYLLVARNL